MKQLRLLVTRIDRIGDVVLSTPIPREIKKKFPDSFIAVLVREKTKDIYLHNPFVDEIIIYNEDHSSSGFIYNIKALKKFKFTHAFMLLPNERLNWILFFSLIPIRIGVGHKLYQFITLSKYVDRKKYSEEKHEADYCLDMVRKIGVYPKSNHPEIYLSEKEKNEVELIKQKFSGLTLIGINSTSGNSAPNLRASEYRTLIEKLLIIPNLKIIVTDFTIPSELKDFQGIDYSAEGASIRDLIKIIASLNVLLSNSTGPMHIASGLKIPTISLFCPLPACSPKLWGPLGNRSKVILPDEDYCSNLCPGDPKRCYFEGAGGIDSEKLFTQVKNFLDLRS